MYKTLITKKCPMCHETFFMKITKEEEKQIIDYVAYGGSIQDKISLLDKFGREFVKTGYCPNCQEMLFNSTLKDNSRYFSENSLRQKAMSEFMNKQKETSMNYYDLIKSDFAKELNTNEKLLFLYEFELTDDLFLDEDGNVKEFLKWL